MGPLYATSFLFGDVLQSVHGRISTKLIPHAGIRPLLVLPVPLLPVGHRLQLAASATPAASSCWLQIKLKRWIISRDDRSSTNFIFVVTQHRRLLRIITNSRRSSSAEHLRKNKLLSDVLDRSTRRGLTNSFLISL